MAVISYANREEIYFEVKNTSKGGICYCQVTQLRKEEISTIVRNKTDFTLTIVSDKNPEEKPINIKPGELNAPYVQRYPETSGTKIKIFMKLFEESESIKIDFN